MGYKNDRRIEMRKIGYTQKYNCKKLRNHLFMHNGRFIKGDFEVSFYDQYHRIQVIVRKLKNNDVVLCRSTFTFNSISSLGADVLYSEKCIMEAME